MRIYCFGINLRLTSVTIFAGMVSLTLLLSYSLTLLFCHRHTRSAQHKYTVSREFHDCACSHFSNAVGHACRVAGTLRQALLGRSLPSLELRYGACLYENAWFLRSDGMLAHLYAELSAAEGERSTGLEGYDPPRRRFDVVRLPSRW